MTDRHPFDCLLTPPDAAIAIGQWLAEFDPDDGPSMLDGEPILDPFAGAGTLLQWAVPGEELHAWEMDTRWGPEQGEGADDARTPDPAANDPGLSTNPLTKPRKNVSDGRDEKEQLTYCLRELGHDMVAALGADDAESAALPRLYAALRLVLLDAQELVPLVRARLRRQAVAVLEERAGLASPTAPAESGVTTRARGAVGTVSRRAA